MADPTVRKRCHGRVAFEPAKPGSLQTPERWKQRTPGAAAYVEANARLPPIEGCG